MSEISLASLLLKFIEAEVAQDLDTMIELGEGLLRSNTQPAADPQAIRIKTAAAYNRRACASIYPYADHTDVAHALPDLNRSLELNPTKEAFQHRGQVYYNCGQYQLALRDFDQAVQLNRKDTGSLRVRADTYRALGRYSEAEADELQIQWELNRSAGW